MRTIQSLNDIELAFNGLDKELASGKKRWEEAIKKARENRDEERLQNLLKKGPPTYKSSRWEGEIEKEHGRIESRVCTGNGVRHDIRTFERSGKKWSQA